MFRNIFAVSFLGIYIAATLQLSFLAFSDTLDDGVLTYMSIGIGLLFTFSINVFQKWKIHKQRRVFVRYASGNTPFHQKLLNFPLILFFATFLSIFIVLLLNHKFASKQVFERDFTVISTGQQRVKYDIFDYAKISDGKMTTKYNLGRKTKRIFKPGDTLTVKLVTGFFGFEIVEDISQ